MVKYLITTLILITIIECQTFWHDKTGFKSGKPTSICRVCVDGYEYVTVDRDNESPSIIQSWGNLESAFNSKPNNVPKRCSK